MKKLLPLLMFIGLSCMAHAQFSFLPINMVLSFNQYYPGPLPVSSEEMIVNDSMIYMMDYGGIEVMNLNTAQTSYKFSGVYYVNMLKPDTGGNFLLVKNDTVLLRYHYPADTFETIPLPVSEASITDVARSASYTWALINNIIVGRYDGQAWILDTMTLGGSQILVKNDNIAYIPAQSSNKLYSFTGDAFNYNFAQPNMIRTNDPMDIDTAGNIWIADSTNLFKVSPAGTVITLNDTINATYPSLPLNVQADKLGNVWVSGDDYLMYHYNGILWGADTSQNYSYTPYTAIDKNSGKFYDLTQDVLITLYTDSQTYTSITNMPYTNISAMNGYYIATDQGIFQFCSFSNSSYYYNNFGTPINFIDTSAPLNPYTFDVTCLVNGNNMTYIDTAHALLYGTHHGVYGLNDLIDNNQLPDTNINYIYYADSIIYIGTNMGLCIYKNNTYTVIDTSNSPLPSNKITYIANEYIQYSGLIDSALYIGTDRGLAIYNTGAWHIFDTAYFHTPNAYITGVVPAGSNYYNYNPYDSTIFISTLGSGLIALKINGPYNIYNTANGYLTNDTVYNVSIQDLGSCGEYLVAAIPGAGLASQPAQGYSSIVPFSDYIPDQITLADSGAFKYYANLSSNYYTNLSVFSPGTGFGITFGGCEGINNIPAPKQQLKWNYQSNMLKVWLPESYSGPCTLIVYNLEGQVAAALKTNVNTNAVVPINANQFAAGIYVVQANLNGTLLQCKTVIER